MSIPTFTIALRLRLRVVLLAALGLIAAILMVGALFPAVGDTFGKLKVGEGVSNLLGGADYGSLRGWLKAEIVSVLGPLVVGAVAITSAVATTAAEEEDRIMALVLAHPVQRSRLVLAKGAAVAVMVLLLGLATWLGLLAGVAIAGGGIGAGDLAAQSVHLAFFGLVLGALALALGAGTGQRTVALGGAAAYGVSAFLINGFAPLVGAIEWLKYLSPFYYYSGSDPLSNGIDAVHLVVLGGVALTLTGVAMATIRKRDLRG